MYYFWAMKIYEATLGEEHHNTATSYNNIGMVYYRQGNYDKALEYCLKDLAVQEKVHGTEHPDTATSYNNIARIYYELGDFRKALDYLYNSHLICEKALGSNHPNTQATLSWIMGVKEAMALTSNK